MQEFTRFFYHIRAVLLERASSRGLKQGAAVASRKSLKPKFQIVLTNRIVTWYLRRVFV